jgi:general secretion pathway protein O
MLSPAEYWQVAGVVAALYPAWFCGFSAVWGGLWASFLGVVAWRGPVIWSTLRAGSSPVLRVQPPTLWGRSSCDHCGTLIPMSRNIPVIAWCWQRGKTACCHRPLGLHHVMGEAAWVLGLPLWNLWAWQSPLLVMSGVALASLLHVGYAMWPMTIRRSEA